MSGQPGYTSLPGSWRSEDAQKKTVIIINGVAVPAVPTGSCLVLLAGLIMWSVGMLQARSTVDGIFSDLGLAAESLDRLKVSVLVGVIVLSVLSVVMLAANTWLELQRVTSSSRSNTPGSAVAMHTYVSNAFQINVANWLLLLLAALAMAGSITWLTTMSTALSATQQTGGYGATKPPSSNAAMIGAAAAPLAHLPGRNSRGVPLVLQPTEGSGIKPVDNKAAAVPGPEQQPSPQSAEERVEQQPVWQQTATTAATTAAVPTTAAVKGVKRVGKGADVLSSTTEVFPPEAPFASDAIQSPRTGSVGKGAEFPELGLLWSSYRTCPPGCVDLGLIAQVLGLPWPCFCQVWLLGDLEEQLQKVVRELWVAVVGALLLFAATSWLYGYLAAQAAHAARDVQDFVKFMQGVGPSGGATV